MSLTQVLAQKPLFKEGVLLNFKGAEIEVRHGKSGCSLTIEPEYEEETVQLLQLLQRGGMSLEELAQACLGIGEDIPELLRELERRNLLLETPREVEPLNGVTGSQFYRELYRFIEGLKGQFPPSPFSQKMVDKTITRNQLIGYALESYHVTHLCPRLLAPSLAHYESPETEKLLQEFFASELHHDRLLEKSLKSVGVEDQQLQQMQPLPMTFAICSSLGVFATAHPLSFKAALLLFEQDDPEFHQLFQERCDALELPEEFYQPMLLHAGINTEGAHEDITGILLAQVSYVSPEEQLVVKQNMRVLLESMVLRTHEILDYYGDSNNIIPRCFV